METPRLDLLIYAHDGRGLGHVSRSAAIGMACRRLFPGLKVLLVSGSRMTGDLIGPAPLDWVKLPAYQTTVVKGLSHGRTSPANFSDAELGCLRTGLLADLMNRCRPRCVLSDHLPQGKHRELQGALDVTAGLDTRWILGVRGIVGQVPGFWSELSISVFQSRYQGIFWYGDEGVLGSEPRKTLGDTFGVPPVETGYVSRPAELSHWQPGKAPKTPGPAVTVSVPWIGENTLPMLQRLSGAISGIGPHFGEFHIYIGFGEHLEAFRIVHELFDPLPFCQVSPMGEAYFPSLLRSRAALIYGGYNSLTDVMFAGIPALVILRGMQDREQESHVRLLNRHGLDFSVLPEGDADERSLRDSLGNLLTKTSSPRTRIRLQGAENSARELARILST
ncbi:MAG: hypothetical protein ACOZF0_22720 [Thermodesulfobacteriota bacterium]